MASTKSHKIRNLLQKGLTPTEVVARLKVSRSMVYKIKTEMVASGELGRKVRKEVVSTAKPTPVTPKQEVVKPKTLWQSIKEWFK